MDQVAYKQGDIKISSLQDSMAWVTSSISYIIDGLLKAQEKKSHIDFKNSIVQLHDCTVLLGHVSQEMSFKCCDSLHPHLSIDFKEACSRNLKLSKMLFGDDLPKTIEALKVTDKVVDNVIFYANGPIQSPCSLAPSGFTNATAYKTYYPNRDR